MQVLNQLCDVIFESLRDRVVTGLLQASLDGLLRVLLDGGPSQLFLPSDAKLMEEDLEVLKEFFISGGDGLPWGVLQNQVTRTRELIDDLKSAIEMLMHGSGSKLVLIPRHLRVSCHRSVNLCSTINISLCVANPSVWNLSSYDSSSSNDTDDSITSVTSALHYVEDGVEDSAEDGEMCIRRSSRHRKNISYNDKENDDDFEGPFQKGMQEQVI
ncbi:Protein unc-13, variant 2 [Trifolium repens]|nr:Protein unc-13, variant 2 [Trifolium repens]